MSKIRKCSEKLIFVKQRADPKVAFQLHRFFIRCLLSKKYGTYVNLWDGVDNLYTHTRVMLGSVSRNVSLLK